MTAITHVLVGPPEHGVTRHGLGVYAACAARAGQRARGAGVSAGDVHRLVHLDSWEQLNTLLDAPAAPGPVPDGRAATALADAEIVQVAFTDALFGSTPTAAVTAVARLVGRAPGERLSAGASRPALSVSVHDVPQPEEGRERFRRRAEAYSLLERTADLVITNSRHEAGFFEAAQIVPLPLEAADACPPPEVPGRPTIGVLGFIYPGKGYERVIDVAPPGVRVRALGAVARGHEEYLEQLRIRARERGVCFEVTGYLAEDELARQLAAVTVPVCPHLHVSASGSLNTWIAHRRRVLAADGPYLREVAERWPGRVILTGTAAGIELGSAIERLIAEPERGWCSHPVPVWGWGEVAAAMDELWRARR